MIFYLTGTGNSRWAARLLADHLQDTAEDAAPYLKSGLTPSLHSEKPWIFVCPTYGWQIPHIFADLLRRTGWTTEVNRLVTQILSFLVALAIILGVNRGDHHFVSNHQLILCPNGNLILRIYESHRFEIQIVI